MEMVFEALDVHLLSKSKTASIDSVVLTPCKIIHEFAKSTLVEILRGSNACNSLQSITILLIGKAQFLFDDMNDSQLLLIKGDDSAFSA